MSNRLVWRWLLVGLVLVCSLRGATAFAEVVAGVSYKVPTGWTSADKDGVRMIAPSSLKSGELMVAMLVGAQAAAGRPDDQIAALAATYNADATVLGATDVMVTDRGAAGSFHMKSFDVQNADLGAHTRMLAILVRGDARAVVLFVFSNNAVLRAHGEGVQALLQSITIVAKPGTLKAPALRPAAPATTEVAATGKIPTGDTGATWARRAGCPAGAAWRSP